MTDTAGTRTASGTWAREQLLLGQSPRGYACGLLTPFNLVSTLIVLAGVPVIAYRFAAGLGAVTHLSQTNPWGLWVGFDILCGVALAAGGYTLAATVILFGLKQYAPVLRPAILTGFLGYFFVVVGLLVDLGQPWHLPYPIVYSYGVTSVMFEVAWCVALYLVVLALEFSPACFEWLGWARARRWAMGLTLGLTVFGVVLSMLHQSSLGALFLMAPTKLHPLWYSPFIPLYFFISSVAAGLSMVIVESMLSHRIFHDRVGPVSPVDLDAITLGLGKAASVVLFTYFFLKLLGVADSGRWDLLTTGMGRWFLVEVLGFVLLPCLLFAHAARWRKVWVARAAAVVTVVGIVVNRLNVSLVAMNWNVPDRYLPSSMEVLISVAIVTIGLLTFRWIVNRMPVLGEHPDYQGAH
jgi:Ni/Fe-hydrogenase subunit HybB-like protein